MTELVSAEAYDYIRKANAEFHTAQRKRYAEDAENHKEPWTLWEHQAESQNNWHPLEAEPLWIETSRYRHINPQEKPYPLSHYGNMRVIVRKNATGDYEGYCENSFDMSWDKGYAYVYASCSMYSFLGEHKLDAVRDVQLRIDQSFLPKILADKRYLTAKARIESMLKICNRTKDAAKRSRLVKYWTKKLEELQATFIDWEVYDPLSPDCPITVYLNDWSMARSNRNSSKYDCRNAKFVQK